MGKKLRMGMIGVGFMGELHAKVIKEIPNAELVAVADINENTAKRVADTYGCDAYTDYNELLARDDIDAVTIVVPEDYHLEPAVAAARAGKHILLEKPIAKTTEEALKIKKAADEAGVRLMVAHILHFDPRYVQLNDAIERGNIGEAIHLQLRRTNPKATPERLKGKISIFYYMGVHDIELMLWYAKSDITRVYAQKVIKHNPEIDCEDSIAAVFNFANGAIGSLLVSWALPKNSALGIVGSAEVVGKNGAGYVDIRDQGLQVYTENNVYFPDTLHWPEVNGQIVADLKDEVQHFVTCTLEDKSYVVSTENTIKAIQVIEGCFESIRTGQPVKIEPLIM